MFCFYLIPISLSFQHCGQYNILKQKLDHVTPFLRFLQWLHFILFKVKVYNGLWGLIWPRAPFLWSSVFSSYSLCPRHSGFLAVTNLRYPLSSGPLHWLFSLPRTFFYQNIVYLLHGCLLPHGIFAHFSIPHRCYSNCLI